MCVWGINCASSAYPMFRLEFGICTVCYILLFVFLLLKFIVIISGRGVVVIVLYSSLIDGFSLPPWYRQTFHKFILIVVPSDLHTTSFYYIMIYILFVNIFEFFSP